MHWEKDFPGLVDGEVLSSEMLDRLYTDLVIDLDSDGLINSRELWLMNLPAKTAEIRTWLANWRRGETPQTSKRRRSRISQQAWIPWTYTTDEVIGRLKDR